MKSAEETIKWVLKFIDMDVDQFREGDWLNLAEDFQQFLGWGGLVSKPQNMGLLQALQKEIRDHLTDLAAGPAPPPPLVPSEPKDPHRPFSFQVTDVSSVSVFFYEKGKWTFNVDAKTYRTLFLMTLVFTLVALNESGQLERLRYCEAPSTEKDKRDCGNLFFAEHGRQQFCSAQCKGREASQRFRYRHKEELRTKAHVRYERNAKAKHGPHVKVSQFRKKKTAKEEG